MSLENETTEEKILSVLKNIESSVSYQVRLLEAVSINIDEMLKVRKKFNPKQQIDALQKIIPGNVDLGKVFASMINVKGESVKDNKE